MLTLPLPKLAVGVNTAVRVKPVPLIGPKVPPVTSTSPALPSHAKLVPGSSEKVNVMLAVSPALRVATSLAMPTVGAVVSTKYLALSVTAAEVMMALLPLASFRVALFKLSALMAMATPLASVWPAAMVVVNSSAVVPEPDT